MPDESLKCSRDRRAFQRYTGKARAILYRESDVMRVGIDGALYDISTGGIGVTVGTSLEKAEQIRVLLLNDVQRVKKEVRGVVRHSTLCNDGQYHVGVALSVRLTPLEVSQLRMVASNEGRREKVWL